MKSQDESAVAEFSRLFGPRLLYFFLRQGLSRADAEALAVTSVTKTWMNIESFQQQGPGSFERWVFRLAKHAWIDEIRRAGKRPAVGIDEHELAAASEPIELVSDTDLIQQVEAAVSELPDLDRAIIRLRYFGSEKTFPEIGRQLGMKDSAARLRHHRALRTLGARLAHLRRRSDSNPGGSE
jgi:RNA polymerase sigma factor (sigma-70 family)